MLAQGFIQIYLTVDDDGEVIDADVMDTNLDNVEMDGVAEVIWDDDGRYLNNIIVNALRKEAKG